MFVGAQLAHLGQRARETRQRPRATFGLGALLWLDVMAADDDFDLRQFPLDRAGDAFDQRDARSRRRIVGALSGGASAHLPFRDRGARHLVGGIDRDRLRTDYHIGGGFGLLAFLDRGVSFAFQGPAGFRFRGFPGRPFPRGFFRRRFFRRRNFAGHTPPRHRLCYRFG
jgi:hypothetical protein